MKRYVYLIIALILMLISFNFGWFFEGQSAIESAKQVLRGYDYQEARTTMMVWQRLHSILDVGCAVFLILFATTFFKKKEKHK